MFEILNLEVDTRDPAKTSGSQGLVEFSRSLMLFANFPISSFSFISPRVSVIMLKSLKL